MLKKALAIFGVAGLLVLGGASGASADGYPPVVGCTASPPAITVGQTSVITCTGLQPNVTGTITTTGPGVQPGTLSSIVFAAATGTSSITRTTSPEGELTITFRAPAAGTFAVELAADNGQSGEATVTVTAAAPLPSTGGTIPAAAIWLGVGAIGIGGIALAAAMARRRAQNSR